VNQKIVSLRLSWQRVSFSALVGVLLAAVLCWSGFFVPLALLLGLLVGGGNLLGLDLPGKGNDILGRLLWTAGPLLSLYLVEMLNLNTLFTDVTTLQVAMNLVWYYLISAIFLVLFGRRNVSARWSAILCVFLGIVNHYIIHFRGRSIFPVDLLTLRTAANVASSYDYSPCGSPGTAILLTAIFLTVVGWLPKQKKRSLPRWQVMAGCAAGWGLYLALFLWSPMVDALGIEPSLWTTRGNGFFLNFSVCLKYSAISKPTDYHAETCQAEMETVTATTGSGDTTPVNIIVVMDESFSDLSVDGALETTADPMPFLHSLTENTIKGHAYTSVFGGTTANSEYEFLTGNSMAFLPAGSVPYQLYVQPGDYSLVDQLSQLGYETVAMHPYKRSGWNRTVVYNNFGFDRILFQDDFTDVTYVRDYISDQSDFENIVRLYEEKEEGQKLFLFNVTMQNHSAYNLEWTNLERSVSLAGPLAGTSSWANQYLSLVKATDSALEYLVGYFSQVEEPTVILFFGDHQPQLSTDFYSKLMGKDVNTLTAEEAIQRYETVFFLWANYDIPEAEDVSLSLNYLSTLLLQQTDLPLTGYQTFLSGLMEELPVVSANGFYTADGAFVEKSSQLPAPLAEQAETYAQYQYNGIGDRKNRVDDFFFLSEEE
jgi:hypothetical protein